MEMKDNLHFTGTMDEKKITEKRKERNSLEGTIDCIHSWRPCRFQDRGLCKCEKFHLKVRTSKIYHTYWQCYRQRLRGRFSKSVHLNIRTFQDLAYLLAIYIDQTNRRFPETGVSLQAERQTNKVLLLVPKLKV